MNNQTSFNYVFIIVSTLFTTLLFSCKKDDEPIPVENYSNYGFEAPEVIGNLFYVDPINGSADGDGSAEHPWQTLQQVLEEGLIETYRYSENYNPNSPLEVVNEGAPVKGGDKLILRNGYHGYVSINYFIFNDWLTIEAEAGHNPVLSQIKLFGTFKNIYFNGLTIKKDSYQGEGNYWDTDAINHNTSSCVYMAANDFWGDASHIKLNNLTIKTTEDIASWTAADWVQKSAGGISLRSVKNVEVYNCTIENIGMGISLDYQSDNSKVVGCDIKNYSVDGARLLSNNCLFAYNSIIGCFDVDENHDDAIQSYSRGEDNSPGTGVVFNNVIRGNLIIGVDNPTHPLAGNPQGIGCFDGMFDGWIIENNVIITNHYHGITFMGMRNSKIVNNTVIDQIEGDDLSPWIRVVNHKSGTPSENCLVANNIVFRTISTEGNAVVERSNYIIGRDNFSMLPDLFVNPAEFDLHLLDNESTREHIIDKGETVEGLQASEIDKDQNTRTLPIDLGAYELQ